MIFDNKLLKELQQKAEKQLSEAESLLGQVENPAMKALLRDALNKAKAGEKIDVNDFLNAVKKANGQTGND